MKQAKQVQFLNNIQKLSASNVSFVNQLADLLEISNDSAYRRLRGDTSLTFEEIGTLCSHYHVSFDAINTVAGGHIVPFHYRSFENSRDNFITYFQNLCQDMEMVSSAPTENKHMMYAGQGLPIFHYFKFPLLSAFKMFYWMKSVLNIDGQINERFDQNLIDNELLEFAQRLFKSYLDVPSTEIWADSTVMGTIHQIQFYWETGIFPNKEIALNVCNDFRELIQYVQDMCTAGKKQDDYQQPGHHGQPIKMYYSEIELEKVTVLVRYGPIRRVYLDQLTFGSIYTEHKEYYEETEGWLNTIIRKSNLISEVSQTMRYQFFNRSLKNLAKLEERIKED